MCAYKINLNKERTKRLFRLNFERTSKNEKKGEKKHIDFCRLWDKVKL